MNENTIILNSFEDALRGITWDDRAVYEIEAMESCLLQQNPSWTYEDAREWLDYNVLDAFNCEYGPVFFYENFES